MLQVTIVVPKGEINLSSVTGSFQILTRANEYWKRMGNKSLMEVYIAGFVTELKLDDGLFSIHPVNIEDLKNTDLVIIPAVGYAYDEVINDNTLLVDWIRKQYKAGAEVASICTGAFVLAATGLLEGKTCSTHWNAAPDFKRRFPGIQLSADNLITAEQGIYTNGGAYSFLNLVLFLVEKYFDRSTAIY